MPMKRILMATVVGLLGACALQPQATSIQLTTEFDEHEALAMIGTGANTIEGTGAIQRSDGSVATCAGSLVELIPATDYATERMSHIYASTVQGASTGGIIRFEPEHTDYANIRRVTRCDADGAFRFEGIADGTFYLVTGVWWTVDDSDRPPAGANLMRRVSVEDGAEETVALEWSYPSSWLERLRVRTAP